ncbi:unnamed protein product, partial [Ectocarpus sp. 4 AP-2014]
HPRPRTREPRGPPQVHLRRALVRGVPKVQAELNNGRIIPSAIGTEEGGRHRCETGASRNMHASSSRKTRGRPRKQAWTQTRAWQRALFARSSPVRGGCLAYACDVRG